MTELQEMPDDEPEDTFAGASGWLVVATDGGRGCYLAVDPGFGGARFFIYEQGMNDPDEWGPGLPEDAGVWRCHAKVRMDTLPEGDRDMSIERTSEWEEVRAGAGGTWEPVKPAVTSTLAPAPVVECTAVRGERESCHAPARVHYGDHHWCDEHAPAGMAETMPPDVLAQATKHAAVAAEHAREFGAWWARNEVHVETSSKRMVALMAWLAGRGSVSP